MRVFKILDPDPYKKVPVPVYGFATLSLSIYAIVATGRAKAFPKFLFWSFISGEGAADSQSSLFPPTTGYAHDRVPVQT